MKNALFMSTEHFDRIIFIVSVKVSFHHHIKTLNVAHVYTGLLHPVGKHFLHPRFRMQCVIFQINEKGEVILSEQMKLAGKMMMNFASFFLDKQVNNQRAFYCPLSATQKLQFHMIGLLGNSNQDSFCKIHMRNWKWKIAVVFCVFFFFHSQSFPEVMQHIEGADGASTDLTWRELINPDSDDNYGAVKDSDVVCFAMGKLDQLSKGTHTHKQTHAHTYIHIHTYRQTDRQTHKYKKCCVCFCIPSLCAVFCGQ